MSLQNQVAKAVSKTLLHDTNTSSLDKTRILDSTCKSFWIMIRHVQRMYFKMGNQSHIQFIVLACPSCLRLLTESMTSPGTPYCSLLVEVALTTQIA